jgi:hypothetical protein
MKAIAENQKIGPGQIGWLPNLESSPQPVLIYPPSCSLSRRSNLSQPNPGGGIHGAIPRSAFWALTRWHSIRPDSQLADTQPVPKAIPPNPTKSQLKINFNPVGQASPHRAVAQRRRSLSPSGRTDLSRRSRTKAEAPRKRVRIHSFPLFPSVKSQSGIRVSSRVSCVSRLKFSSSVPSVSLWQKLFDSFALDAVKLHSASTTKSTAIAPGRTQSHIETLDMLTNLK